MATAIFMDFRYFNGCFNPHEVQAPIQQMMSTLTQPLLGIAQMVVSKLFQIFTKNMMPRWPGLRQAEYQCHPRLLDASQRPRGPSARTATDGPSHGYGLSQPAYRPCQ